MQKTSMLKDNHRAGPLLHCEIRSRHGIPCTACAAPKERHSMTADRWSRPETPQPGAGSGPDELGELLPLTSMAAGSHGGLAAGIVVEATRDAVARSSPQDALRAVIDMAVESGPCDAVSLTTLGRGRTVTTEAHSSDQVLQADRLQYELGEGPCLDAVWTNGVYLVPNLIADGRWPRWAPRAAQLGIGASLSIHLFTDTRLGSLNLYSLNRRGFDPTEVETARVIAAHVSVVVAYAHTTQNLWRAVDARNLIGQAQGMLMARYGLTAPKAFAVLRRYSQHHNIKLTVLAEQLTSTGQLPDLDRRHPHDPN